MSIKSSDKVRIFDSLVTIFPGLVDGNTNVNGSDLVEYLTNAISQSDDTIIKLDRVYTIKSSDRFKRHWAKINKRAYSVGQLVRFTNFRIVSIDLTGIVGLKN